MAQKRPFDGEILDNVSFKNPKYRENDGNTFSLMDNFGLQGASEQSGGFAKVGSVDQEPINNLSPRVPDDEYEAGLTRSVSLSPWATSSTSEDDDNLEAPFHLPLSPDCFSFDRPVRSVQADDVYHALLDYPPRKRIPVGPDYQAEIPELGVNVDTRGDDGASEGSACAEQTSDDSHIVHGWEDLAGACVIPRSESDPPVYNGDEIGQGRSDCSCMDRVSVRCVRQHVAEARDKLRKTIGEEVFEELGFCDMGEVVAEKWSEEEEQLFHEVVYANPVSLGKNFWNVLSSVFPSRTMMEIVSYYFNVFVLRKRAEQNRYDPFNADSDDDEWQVRNGDADDGGMTDEDDFSVTFPFHHDYPYDVNGNSEDVLDESCADDDNTTDAGKGADPAGQNDHYSIPRLSAKGCHDDGDHDPDAQDGSCTSSDSGNSSQGGQMNPHSHEEWREYILTPCDNKVWDGYMNWSKNKVDFLPTCSVIEEVFGDGNFEFQGKRW